MNPSAMNSLDHTANNTPRKNFNQDQEENFESNDVKVEFNNNLMGQ